MARARPKSPPSLRGQRWVRCALVAHMLLLIVACDRAQPSPALKADPRVLELVSLRSRPDNTHTVEIQANDGTLWYRETEAGLNLQQCDIDRAWVVTAFDGSFGWDIPIVEAHWDNLRSWSRVRVGQPVGCVFDGRLLVATELKSPVSSNLQIPGFTTREDAAAALAKLRAVAAALRGSGGPG